jgi:sirohydrochlorin cobaltochelatase
MSPRKGIVVVAFGTARPEARRAFERFHDQVGRAFPGIDIRWAFTSRFMRKKLLGEGDQVDSPEVVLARMMEEGFTHVAVLPLHVIPGREFHELAWNAALFARMTRGIEKVQVARPLLSSHGDMARVAEVMMGALPAWRKPGDAVLFIGHGNANHPADAVYAAMHCAFQELDPCVFVGTLSGYPGPEQIFPKLTSRGIRKAFLIPLMAVAGHHARKDMGGDKAGSWKSILTENGIDCEVILSGMAEQPGIAAIWLEHLQVALENLEGHA